MSKISEKIEKLVNRILLSSGCKKMVVGVSGGADSTALLVILSSLRVKLTVVHCNFHLRGDESDRDSLATQMLCKRLDIPLTTIDFDTKDYMRQNGVSTEVACRELRYAEFRRIMQETNSDRIAVAHNADDNAETLLLNLMRGAGVSGLRGMRLDTGEIIRPLLGVSRNEILEYLEEKGYSYVVDSSNLSSDYRRNFLRNEVLPLLRQRWPSANKSICRSAEILAQEEKMLKWAEKQFMSDKNNALPYSKLSECPEPLWLIRRFVLQFGASSTQAEEIAKSVHSENFLTGKYWSVRNGRIYLERDAIRYTANNKLIETEEQFSSEDFEVTPTLLEKIKRAPLSELWTIVSPEDIEFRNYHNGDRIKPLGMTGSTLVSKILKDTKLSAIQKANIKIAIDKQSGELLWIEGLKRARIKLATDKISRVWRYRKIIRDK